MGVQAFENLESRALAAVKGLGTLAVFLVSVLSGCQVRHTVQTEPAVQSAVLPPDVVMYKVDFVLVPAGQDEQVERLWSSVTEQLYKEGELRQSGLRTGRVAKDDVHRFYTSIEELQVLETSARRRVMRTPQGMAFITLDPRPGERTIFYRRSGGLVALDTVDPSLKFRSDTTRLSDHEVSFQLWPILVSEGGREVMIDNLRIEATLALGDFLIIGGFKGGDTTLGSLFYDGGEQTLLVIYPSVF